MRTWKIERGVYSVRINLLAVHKQIIVEGRRDCVMRVVVFVNQLARCDVVYLNKIVLVKSGSITKTKIAQLPDSQISIK